MTENLNALVSRAMQLLDRLEAVLPQALSAPDWNAAIAWRYRKRSSGHGVLEPVRHVAAIRLDDVLVVDRGGRASSYREEDGQRVMKQDEIGVRVDLGRGRAAATVWTCDFSHDYVSINADYRS